MDDRMMYLKDLEPYPLVLASLKAAKNSTTKTATLSFSQFHDDAFALYATLGIAGEEGVHVLFRADRRQ